MGGLTSAVHWWEEWQLRVLALASLFVQFLLFVSSRFRRLPIPRWCRFIMWLAYLAGDAVAIYALATLFNRHKEADPDGGGGGRSSALLVLEVVWAPVLLLHLGGVEGITAYNIEDNELWSRHLLTAVSQVTVAIYVFCKSWPQDGDKRLLQAAILLFVPGIVKCFQKPLALKRASIYSLVSSAAAAKQSSEGEKPYPLEEYVTRANDFVSAFVPEQQHREHLRGRQREGRRKFIIEVFIKLFVDLSSPYHLRLSILQHFWRLTDERAHAKVKHGLSTAFMLLYTKIKTTACVRFMGHGLERERNWGGMLIFLCSQCILFSRPCLPWTAIFAFYLSDTEAYAHTDVKITYALLCCTAALENYSFFAIFIPIMVKVEWPEKVAQYSLIGYFACNKRHSKLMWIISFLDQQHWCTGFYFSSSAITKLVLGYLKGGWTKEIIKDSGSTYLKFNNHNSHWVLPRNHHSQVRQGLMRKPFDESVLLWHLATDFCFYSSSSSEQEHCDAFDGVGKDILCRKMSNYMVYLLFFNPEMLLPGSRRNLFIVAHEELEAIFKDEKPPLKKRELVENIIGKMESSSQVHPAESTLIHDAWMIAQDLKRRHNNNNNAMWEEIQRVWVEMLCFSASRCRGFLHAKALGQGGEFLSYVWLLLFHMGMETFTDKLQRTTEEEHPIIPSRDQNNGSAPLTTTAPSTSEVRIDLDPIA